MSPTEDELGARRIVKLPNGEEVEVHFELLEMVWS